MEKPKIDWWVKGLTINIERTEYLDLTDNYGVVYHRYPKALPKATFEITGEVQWEGAGAWTKEKLDGLVPFLNAKLKEYEENEVLHRRYSNGPDAPGSVRVSGL